MNEEQGNKAKGGRERERERERELLVGFISKQMVGSSSSFFTSHVRTNFTKK